MWPPRLYRNAQQRQAYGVLLLRSGAAQGLRGSKAGLARVSRRARAAGEDQRHMEVAQGGARPGRGDPGILPDRWRGDHPSRPRDDVQAAGRHLHRRDDQAQFARPPRPAGRRPGRGDPRAAGKAARARATAGGGGCPSAGRWPRPAPGARIRTRPGQSWRGPSPATPRPMCASAIFSRTMERSF